MSSPRRRALVTVAVTAAALLVLLVIADSTIGLRPQVCATCHLPQAQQMSLSSHSQADCLSCHLEAGGWSLPAFKVDQWTGMYPAQLLGWPLSPARPISREACVSCHDSIDAAVVTESRGLRIAHASCAPAPEKCDSCHGVVAHGEATRWGGQPVMEECVECHSEAFAPRECDTCHAGKEQTDRLRRGPWRVTHGPEWRSTHAMGSYASCATCHASGFCVKCHGVQIPHPASFGSAHGSFALKEDSECASCHSITSFCEECHSIEMPHPDLFLQGHSEAAESADDPLCASCHGTQGCTGCHERHVHPGGSNPDGTLRLRRR